MESEGLDGEVDFTVNFQRFCSFMANGYFYFYIFFLSYRVKEKKFKKNIRYSRTTFHTVLRLVKVASILHAPHTPNQCRDGKPL